MALTRTTLRLRSELKKKAEAAALEKNTTLQTIFNEALENYLKEAAKKKANIIFKTHDLGIPLDNLTRADYYTPPQKQNGPC